MSGMSLSQHGTASDRTLTLAWWTVYVTTMAGGLLIAAVARRQIFEPYVGVSLGLIALLLTGWVLGPRPTLYVMLTLTAISDLVTVSWFPFAKNLSSRESIAFVSDQLSMSPLDAMVAVGLVVTVLRHYARHRRLMASSRMTPVTLAFGVLVVYGFLNGVLSGAPLRLAVIESRPVWYIPAVFVICVNVLTEAAHMRHALWAVLIGVTIQSLLSIEYYWSLSSAGREALESLNEHGSAIGQNLVMLTLVLILVLGVGMRGRGTLLAIAAVPTAFVYLVSQRRAGFGALLVGTAIGAVALLWHRRRLFWILAPIATLVLAGYTLAFWNSTGSAGFAAQAVKSIVAPDQASAEDQSSDQYRLIEGYDLWFTIHATPLRGLGFGHPFYRPVPLPEISDFELSPYISHNSILWVWVKLGFVGFVAMLAMVGRALMMAAERIRGQARDPDLVVTAAAAGFVAMFVVFTWFDISWDARNTVLLGLMLAICGRVDAPTHQPPVTPATTRANPSA